MNKLLSIAATVALGSVSLFAQNGGPKETAPVVVHKIHGAPPVQATGGTGTTGNGIAYNGGPVMLNGINMYYIYYGNWGSHPNAPGVLNNFANNIGESPYFNINTTYFDSTNTNVKNQVTLAGSVTSSYTAANPTSLTFGDIFGIVSRAFTNDGLAPDPSGVYFVLTAPGVAQSNGSGSSFLSQYCGWHTASTYNSTWIKYAFIGDANGNYSCTGPITNPDPTQDIGAYAMASVIAHELEESTTDPLITAWYNSGNQENADLCAWKFGTTYTASNGALANMSLGGHDFMIQQNWVNANGGSCLLSYASAPDYNLTLTTSSSVSVLPGNTATYGIGINAVGGFNSNVNLSVSGLPAGATPGFSPNPMTTSSTLTVTTTVGTTPGTYPLTISGTGGTPSLLRTIAATLIVTAPPTPDFTLSVSPSTQTVTQGNPTSYNVTINPTNGFTGSVTLSITTTLPAGVNPTFVSGAPGTPGSVTLSTSTSTPAGSYPFTIQGGGKTHTIGATLVVNSVGSYSITISPNPLTIKRPSSGVYTITVTPSGGFNTPVTLTIAGLPSKVTASAFSPNPVAPGSTSSVTITAARNATATKKPATITVTGKGGGLSFFGTSQLNIQ